MHIAWNLLIPFLILELLLMIIALVDCIRNEHTNGPKWLWILLIVLLNLLGPLLYFIVGRKQQV